jgi:hypothetical protein
VKALLLAAVSLALAQEDPGLDPDELALPDDEPVEYDSDFGYDPDVGVGETIVVTDEYEVKRRQQAMINELRRLGYKEKKDRNGRTVYVSDVPWEPKVIVDDDGWMILRRRMVVLTDPDLPDSWWFSDTPLEYLTCVVAPHMCVRLGGMVISKRKLAHKKEAVVEATEDELQAWGDALAGAALQDRLYEELPAQLDAVWLEGVTPEGEQLPTHGERRAWILELWLNRTDNPWGDAAREAIEAYMEFVIQASPAPYTAAEISAANARRKCQRELVLTVPLANGP